MKAKIASVIGLVLIAIALPVLGPADGARAFYIVGGADCNHSDIVEWDCVEINGRDPMTDPCDNFNIGATDIQQCLDVRVASGTICTENNCENETKDKISVGNCTEQNCGS